MSALSFTKTYLQKKVSLLPKKPFEIISLNRSENNENRENDILRNHQTFKICWITGGRTRCRVDLEEFELGVDNLLCVTPGKIIRFAESETPRGYIISFTDSFLSMEDQEFDPNYQQGLSQVFSLSGIVPVQEEIRTDMEGIAERMQKEYDNIFLHKEQILRRYLKIFLIFLSRHSAGCGDEAFHCRGIELSHEFMGLLEKNFKSFRSITSYARELSVTPNHLNVVVKKNTGHTAGYHVKQRLILEAKRLAVYSNLCMKEIADELGFSDPAHFSKFFKNSSGVNFSDFKREHVRFPLTLTA